MEPFKGSIEDHPLYGLLTPRQQKFCVEYVKSKDKMAALRAAGYNFSTIAIGEMLARRNFHHQRIKAIIAAMLGVLPEEGILTRRELLLIVSEGARTCKERNTLYKFCHLYAELQGWTKDPTKLGVPHLVRQMEMTLKRKKIKES